MASSTEIAIIGASGAGLLAGYLLARQGYEVTVFEQQPHYRPARRTLIVTSALQQVLPFEAHPAILHKTPWMTVATSRQEVTLRFRVPDLIVERSALLQYLLEQARRAGCRIVLGHRFQGWEAASDGSLRLHLERQGETVQVTVHRALIGADGVTSDVARALGLPLPPRIPILQAEVALPAGWDPRRTQVWFFPQETRYFYWLIPESEHRGVLGLMTDAHVSPKPLLEAFLKRWELTPLAYQGAQVALYHPRLQAHRRVGRVDIYLLGDAAGHVKNTTVGGTVTGFWAAQAAARAIHQGRPWKETARGLYRELRLHWWIRRALHGFSEAGYDLLLRCLTPSVRNFLERRTRDEMAPALWKTLLTTPALWRLAPHVLRSLRRPFPEGG